MKPAIYSTLSTLLFVGFLAGFLWLGIYVPYFIFAILGILIILVILVILYNIWLFFYDIYADAKADENDLL